MYAYIYIYLLIVICMFLCIICGISSIKFLNCQAISVDKSHLSPLVLDKHPAKDGSVSPLPTLPDQGPPSATSGPPSASRLPDGQSVQHKVSGQPSPVPKSAGPSSAAVGAGGGGAGVPGTGGLREDDKGSIINTFTDELNGYAQTASNTISELFG